MPTCSFLKKISGGGTLQGSGRMVVCSIGRKQAFSPFVVALSYDCFTVYVVAGQG